MKSPNNLRTQQQHRAHIRQLTSNLAQYHTPPLSAEAAAAGFLGWHSRSYLPHFDIPDQIQSVNFRLADSLPADVLRRLAAMSDSPAKRELRETTLDAGRGACWLGIPEIATLVQDALLHFDGDRYRVCAWCVMPNHVHALLEVTHTPLGSVMQSWKGYTARMANQLLGRRGTFWQEEYWDRYIRDADHFRETVRYIESNPVTAHLVPTPDPKTWPWSSARFRNEYGKLQRETREPDGGGP